MPQTHPYKQINVRAQAWYELRAIEAREGLSGIPDTINELLRLYKGNTHSAVYQAVMDYAETLRRHDIEAAQAEEALRATSNPEAQRAARQQALRNNLPSKS